MSSFILYYITDRSQLTATPLVTVIRETLRAGVDMVQIREKDLPTRELTALVDEAVGAAKETPSRVHKLHARVLVNDRLDVALAAGAEGVHLGGQSMPVSAIRKVAPRPFVVGASCHSLAEAMAAESDGADYLLFGPVFETPSKLKYGPPLGLEELRKATAQARVPVMALGGVTVERVRPCLEAGASGVAGIRIFQDCESMEARVRELRALG